MILPGTAAAIATGILASAGGGENHATHASWNTSTLGLSVVVIDRLHSLRPLRKAAGIIDRCRQPANAGGGLEAGLWRGRTGRNQSARCCRPEPVPHPLPDRRSRRRSA